MKSNTRSSLETDTLDVRAPGGREVQLSRLSLRHNDMLRSAVDWLWETDARLALTYVSPPVATTLGVPAQILTGRSLFDLLGLEDSDREGGIVIAAIAARQPFRDEHFTLDSGTGASATFRITGVPYYDVNTGDFAGFRGTGTALRVNGDRAAPTAPAAKSLLRLLESALARKDQLEWELMQAGDQALQTRLAGIAHELRTPLNAIIGFAQVIMEQHLGEDPARYQDYARNINESGLHMLEVVNDLIDLAKIDAGHQTLDAESLDVESIAASALRMLEDKAQEAGVALINDIPAELPRIRGERHALRQILLNLVTNAIKYTPSGGSAGLEAEIGAPDTLTLTVWDNGVGIAPEEQERVFERAYRVAETGLERPGSGLGLAISRNLARAMGGDITIASTPGRGTRVTLSLPLEPPSDEAASAPG